jgi:hypothetical protein
MAKIAVCDIIAGVEPIVGFDRGRLDHTSDPAALFEPA